MTILHVENNADTRNQLALVLGVEDHRFGGRKYISTGIVAAAEDLLSEGRIEILVLDLGLRPGDQPKLLRLVLDREHPDPRAEEDFDAYRLALLAHSHEVPCALLTNFADPLFRGKGVALDAIRDAFHAERVFQKDEFGISDCAQWVREKLRSRSQHVPR